MISCKQIIDWLTEREETTPDHDNMTWLLDQWPEISTLEEKILTTTDLKIIRQRIKQVPTGKQRLYRQALDLLVRYLAEACFWSVPEEQQKQLIDREHQWFERLTGKAETAYLLQQQYERDRKDFIQHGIEPTPAFTALTIAIKVAPVSLTFLAKILNTPENIQITETITSLKVEHITGKDIDSGRYFTRYHLDLFSYRVLIAYFSSKQSQDNLTAISLFKQLNQYCENIHSYFPLFTPTDFHLTFQAIWHFHHQLGPTLLKDFSDPERHVAIPEAAAPAVTKPEFEKIYIQDWDQLWHQKKKTSAQPKWPHLALIKDPLKAKSLLTSTIPDEKWQSDNILPQMLYRYTADLLEYGGVKKPKLALGTISNYTNVYHCLESMPLSYINAIDPQELQRWVKRLYGSQTNDSNRKFLFYFLRFMQTQALTDHLSLSEFRSPLIPSSVDPARLSLNQLDQIIDGLLTAPHSTQLQRLFCAVGVILGYYGMLRRGELLRLRYRDIQSLDEKGSGNRLFKLEVTKTPEGSTKSRKSRTVYVVLPDEHAKLVLSLLHVRMSHPKQATLSANTPLLSFYGEKISSRNQFYLLPITRALKAVCGSKVRFHHLRHSGVHLWFLQLMHLFYNKTPDDSLYDEREKRLLSHDVTKRRLRYWLEGRSLMQINSSLVYDEFIKMIGHEHYATTRWSYLHGLDWLAPIVLREQRQFSHAELRFLLGLSPKSPLPERLKKHLKIIGPDNQKSPLCEISDAALRKLIFSRSEQQAQNHQDESMPDANRCIKLWLYPPKMDDQKTNLFSLIQSEFIKKVSTLNDDVFSVLSCIQDRLGCHSNYSNTKSQLNAFHTLWNRLIEADEKTNNYRFSIPCNQQFAEIYQTVFSETELRLFNRTLTLELNRKTDPARYLDLLKTRFMLGNETLSITKHDRGKTQLIISLSLPLDLSDDCRKIIHECLDIFSK